MLELLFGDAWVLIFYGMLVLVSTSWAGVGHLQLYMAAGSAKAPKFAVEQMSGR